MTTQTPHPIDVVVRALDVGGQPVAGALVSVGAGANQLTLTESPPGVFTGRHVHTVRSGEIPIVASAPGVTVTRRALVLPFVDAAWDQPEAVPGLVNSGGTEDSSTVSPDGQWMILGTYSPVDLLCCFFGCNGALPNDSRSPYCNVSLGPVSGPTRPDMLGAGRVLSPTDIWHHAEPFCVGADAGVDVTFQVPAGDGGVTDVYFNNAPVGSFGFRRQPDGSWAEPFFIGIDADGIIGTPFCYTFLSNPTGNTAEVVFGYQRTGIEDNNRPFYAQLNLGQTNILGRVSCGGGAATFSNGIGVPLPTNPATQVAGNTAVGGGYLWSDDEGPDPNYAIAAPYTGTFPNITAGPWEALAVPEPGDDISQPVLDGNRVFYNRNVQIWSSAWNGSAPSLRGNFGPPRQELASDPPVGSITGAPVGTVIAMGQPTFAHPAGQPTEMYFVYYRTTATGLDGQIGVVRARN